MSDEERTFKSAAEVARYVRGRGYSAHDNTVRAHVKKRMLLPHDDGQFYKTEVDLYAKAHLKKKGPDLEGAAVAKAQRAAQTRLITAKAEREEAKVKQEAGQLISRKQHELALTARARLLKANVTRFFERNIEELVIMVGGDIEKVPEALEYCRSRVEGFFAVYAKKGKITMEATK